MGEKLEIALDVELTPAQSKIDESQARYKVVKAGRRFGKSIYAIVKTLQTAMMNAGVEVWYIGPYYGQVEAIAWEAMLASIPKGWVRRKNETKLRIWLKNGSLIKLAGADNENSLRGVGAFRPLRFVVFEEAAYIKPHVWEKIIRPPLIDGKGNALFISTPRQNWFSRLYKDALARVNAGDKDWAVFHFTIYDNPTIDKGEIDKARAITSERTWRQEYLAQEVFGSGLVYPEFSEVTHVVRPFAFPRDWWQCLAFDWGLRNPSAGLWLAVDPDTRKVYVTQEHYQAGWTVHKHAQRIKELSSSPRDNLQISVIDPSAKRREAGADARTKEQISSVLKEFQNNGIHFLRADNRKNHGIELVRRFLEMHGEPETPGLYIFDDLHNTLRELQSYEYEDGDDEGEGSEDPKKLHDHAMDALRYGICEIYRANVACISAARDKDGVGRLTQAQVRAIKENPSNSEEHPHNIFYRRKLTEAHQASEWSRSYIDA